MSTPVTNRSIAVSLVALVLGMVLLSFAAVPLYQLFCQVTGFGGTTQRAEAFSGPVLDRTVTITFNADVDANMPWKFKPTQTHTTVRIGEMMLASYRAENTSDQPVTGMATYNVTPHEAGKYFHKVYCFCFEQQTLQPHQVVNMPISFYVDPKIVDDPNVKDVKDITLSYTFFNELSKNEYQ